MNHSANIRSAVIKALAEQKDMTVDELAEKARMNADLMHELIAGTKPWDTDSTAAVAWPLRLDLPAIFRGGE